ncbi:unnamed protein product, partial [Meganyctiphanes norvegica]
SADTSSKVKVLSLNADIWTPSYFDVYARFNLTSGEVLSQFTVCYRLYATAFTTVKQHFSYFTHQDDLTFYHYKQNFNTYFLGKSQLKMLNSHNFSNHLPLRTWTHYCHVFDEGQYSIIVNGKIVLSNATVSLQDDSSSVALPLNGTLILGQEQDLPSGGYDSTQTFQGFIAQVNIWSRPLRAKEIEDIAKCKINLIGDVLSLDSDVVSIELKGGALLEEKKLQLFCDIKDKYVIFPEEYKIEDIRTFCSRVGGHIYLPQSQEKSQELYKTALNFSALSSNNYLIWLGATDEENEGVWKKFDSDEVITTFFPSGHRSGGKTQNCIYMHKTSGNWEDQRCKSLRESLAVCEDNTSKHLRLRGLCADAEEKTHFQFLDQYKNGKPIFHGSHGYIIYFNGSTSWYLHDTQLNSTVAETILPSGDQYPIGLQTWISRTSMCHVHQGSALVMSLSTCTDDEYMCQSGDCVPIAANCDLKDDCADLSDEDNCTVVKISSSYHKNRPPKNAKNETPLSLLPMVSIKRISKVDDVNEAISMELTITQIWNDSRLIFINLLNEKALNKLTKSEEDSLWQPQIVFANDILREVRLESTKIQVERTGSPQMIDFNDVYMDTTYNGSSGQLHKSELYDGSFHCSLDVFLYPFDSQRCTVVFESNIEKRMVVFVDPRIEYLGSVVLSSYIVSDFKATKIQPQNLFDQFQVEFTLQRRFSRIIIVVFVPSSMLLCIGLSTLFIRVQLTQVRLIVSLTTLLVLYTLSTQVSATLPTTAYIKMIDIWFFFCICLLFVIIIFHVFVEYLDKPVEVKMPTVTVSPTVTYLELSDVMSITSKSSIKNTLDNQNGKI